MVGSMSGRYPKLPLAESLIPMPNLGPRPEA